ncbi:MAG: hypothetical protein ABR577_04555 [Pyrinomonadaceae bacterium]
MDNKQAKELCLALMHADTEEELIALLRAVGLWDDPKLWRFYGDYENNYNTMGNQQSRPDSALVEKLVNSVDARLMNECLVRGINPESSNAPQSIREAVARFFDESPNPNSSTAGLISEWSNAKRTEVARGITLAATGFGAREGNPCLTISDIGEGQTPPKMPHTFLSVTGSNKLRIPFVQGKFNMGGTGVLKFCGRHNLQLILSRRNPKILNGKFEDKSDSQWSFTIVRRENPEGGRRSSAYIYLAPLGADKNAGKGEVLRFSADAMPIFPEGRKPYARDSEWGTLIKLYEYAATGFKSNIIFSGGGLLSRVDLLLPDVALPIRLHECRTGYRGHEGSFETSLIGLGVRLADNKGENLEEGFPSSCPMSAAGEQMTATIYAFKKGKAETYRKNEGIIFTLNGQTHGYLTPDFFRRTKTVGLSYLSDSLLVIVDCSKFTGRAREDLFMNSRDRLSGGDLRIAIERALEDMLKHHEGLRALKERRRREEIASKLEDSKPLEDILELLLKHSPALSALFLKGNRLSNPFKTIKVRTGEIQFEGARYPTFFKFKGKEYGVELHRDCHIDMRCRIGFETDAANDYFSRDVDPGEFSLFRVMGEDRHSVTDYVGPNLQNGAATLSVQLPVNCREGDTLHYVASVTDRTRIEPFENPFVIHIKGTSAGNGTGGGKRKPRIKEEGDEGELPIGISLPNITKVYEAEWGKHSPAFDKYTALRIKHAGTSGENGNNGGSQDVYDFYINMDNLYLNSELKSAGQDAEIIRARFIYGMVLLGLALLQQEVEGKSDKHVTQDAEDDEKEDGGNIEDRVDHFCKGVAPVLLPLIDSLGALDLEESAAMVASGEAT